MNKAVKIALHSLYWLALIVVSLETSDGWKFVFGILAYCALLELSKPRSPAVGPAALLEAQHATNAHLATANKYLAVLAHRADPPPPLTVQTPGPK